MISSRLEYLFDRYFDKTCTDQEKAELMFLLQDLPDMDLQQLIQRAYTRQTTAPPLPAHSARTILASILERNDKRVIDLQDRPRPLPFLRRLAGVAAAVLLLCLAGSYLWVHHHSPGSFFRAADGPAAFKSSMPPGHSGAILTLAGGTTVLLDSAHNGALTTQGNVQVINRNGQLVYNTLTGSHEILYNIITTPRGRQYQLMLADGSKVWLNSASSLRYPAGFTGNSRQVELTGEGYFEVADDAAHPFIVKTKNMDVHVLGTGFNVMAYDDEDAVRTTLIYGSVKVKTGDKETLINPGQQASAAQGNGQCGVSNPDITEVLAWKEGKFRFWKSGIQPIMRQIARWYDVEIAYKGALPDVQFTGVFPRKEDVSELLEVLEDAGKVHFSMEGNTIVVTKTK
jgi:transmembrane sensor